MGKHGALSAKEAIKRAMLQLMATESHMDITVAELAQTAGVARVSFYRNFTSTSDVVDAIVGDCANEFVEEILPALNSASEREWRRFLFEFFYRMSQRQRMLDTIDPRNTAVLASRMDAAVQTKTFETQEGPLAKKYDTAAKFGLVNSVAKRWMDTGMRETPEEMVDYVLSLVTRIWPLQ